MPLVPGQPHRLLCSGAPIPGSSIDGSRLDDKAAAGHTNKLGPVDPAAVRVAARRAASRWWDPFFVLVIAAIAWLVGLVFLFGVVFVGWRLLGPTAKLGTVSTEFFAPLAAAANFYLALLLVMRSLAKRRGRPLFASYLPSIGIRPVIYAALSGISLTGIYLTGIFGLSLTSFFQNHPLPHEVLPLPQSFGQLVALGLLAVIIAPITEELYWRGLVLDCLQQKMATWVSAAITAVLFSLSHVYFWCSRGSSDGWQRPRSPVSGCSLRSGFSAPVPSALRSQPMPATMQPSSCAYWSSVEPGLAGSRGELANFRPGGPVAARWRAGGGSALNRARCERAARHACRSRRDGRGRARRADRRPARSTDDER